MRKIVIFILILAAITVAAFFIFRERLLNPPEITEMPSLPEEEAAPFVAEEPLPAEERPAAEKPLPEHLP